MKVVDFVLQYYVVECILGLIAQSAKILPVDCVSSTCLQQHGAADLSAGAARYGESTAFQNGLACHEGDVWGRCDLLLKFYDHLLVL